MDYKIQNGKIGDESRFAYIQVEGWRAAYSDILAPEVLKKYLDIEYVTSIYRKLMEKGKWTYYASWRKRSLYSLLG